MPINDPNDSLYSKRQEDKFIASRKDLEPVLNELDYYLEPDYPNRNTDYVDISSTYFDTPDLKFLLEHLNHDSKRSKVRLRQYADNGKYQNKKYLEVKYLENDSKMKERLQVDAVMSALITGGGKVPQSCRKLNSDMSQEEYDKAVKVIEDACKGGLLPTLQINYCRYCFKGSKLRVTVDKDIKSIPLSNLKDYNIDKLKSSPLWVDFEKMGNRYNPASDIVIEVKCKSSDDIPKWLNKILSKFTNDEDTPFSKYVYSIYQDLT